MKGKAILPKQPLICAIKYHQPWDEAQVPSQQSEWGWRRVNGVGKSLRLFSQDQGSSFLQKCSAQKSLSLSFAHEAVLDVGRKSEQGPK